MAIRNKDGSIYKLKGPNPIFKEQEIWDKSKITLVNFEFQEEVEQSTKEIPKIPVVEEIVEEPPQPIIKPEPIIEKEPEINMKESVVVPEKPTTTPPPKTKISSTLGEEPPIFSGKVADTKIVVYCLPVIEEIIKDAVFGTETKVNKFGTKVILEAVMVEEEDMFCVFWAKYDVPPKSIVYPRNHSKRWWQVQATNPYQNGFLMTAILTHANPDFTDD